MQRMNSPRAELTKLREPKESDLESGFLDAIEGCSIATFLPRTTPYKSAATSLSRAEFVVAMCYDQQSAGLRTDAAPALTLGAYPGRPSDSGTTQVHTLAEEPPHHPSMDSF